MGTKGTIFFTAAAVFVMLVCTAFLLTSCSGTEINETQTDTKSAAADYAATENDGGDAPVDTANTSISLSAEHVHVYESTVIAATCTEQGYTVHACFCGVAYTDSYTAPAGHAYESVVTEPTCTAAGYTTYTCTNCGDSYTAEETGALGHDYVTTTVPPTCASEGLTRQVCSRCGDTIETAIAKLDHTWDAGTVTKAATCTAEGTRTYTCTGCGAVRISSIAATGHHYDVNVIAPNCIRQGYTYYYCTYCGDWYKDSYTAVTDHHWYVVRQEENVLYYKCSVCAAARTEYITAA